MLKRSFDVLLSVTGLVIASPALLVLVFVGAIQFRGKVFFHQTRPGMHGKPFTIHKLRTMKDEFGKSGRPLPDAERLTRYGRWLRRTSLDELPELWNVLRGDMSLVGPRPLLMQYLPLYSKEQARRHEVRPGLTGWSQINGRNNLDWEARFAADVWYVENKSIALDLKILFKTVDIVFRARGVNQQGQATMQAFTGRDQDSREKSIENYP